MGFFSQCFDSPLRGLEMSLSLVSEGQLPLGVCHRQRVSSHCLCLTQAAPIQPLKLGSSFTHPGHGGHFCDAVNVPSINPLFPCWMEGCVDRWSLLLALEGATCSIGKFPDSGSNQSWHCCSTLQPQQCQIQATSVAHTTAQGNAGLLNPLHKARAQTHVLMDSSQILHLLSNNGISLKYDLVMVCTSFLSANSIAFFSFPF